MLSHVSGVRAEDYTVTDVVDGDTVIVNTNTIVQLIGVDALGDAKGNKKEKKMDRQVKYFTAEFLLGKKVSIEFDPANRLKNNRDRFERLLGYVYLEDGTLFNLVLIQQGYAKVYDRYAFDYEEKFKNEEKRAKKELKGLWKVKMNSKSSKKSRKIYVARKGSKTYHEGSCLIAHEISLDDRVTFHEEDAARKLGYKPGKWCIPVLMKRF